MKVTVDLDDGQTLVGFVAVVEFVDDNGERRLARVPSDGVESWQASGYLYEALHGRLSGRDG